jgi:hypothetical protein
VAIAKVLLFRSHICYSLQVALRVDWDEAAREELRRLPAAERLAVLNDRAVRLAEERLKEVEG